MKWEKKGLIFRPDKNLWWQQHYGILPTPVYIKEKNCIRIYFSTACKENFGRVTYIDVAADDPSIVLHKHDTYILDIGQPGTFDDCGVNCSSVVSVNGKTFLYYVGYQRCQKTPFMLFPGLATNKNDEAYVRISSTPIIDRSNTYPFSLAAPFVMFDKEIFRMWLWIADQWTTVNGKQYLSASIGYAESNDGVAWVIVKSNCVVPDRSVEFSVGRPWVIKDGSIYKMFYSVRYIDKLYRLGFAESFDGLVWIRKDNDIGIDVSDEGWDSDMVCYPAVITAEDKTYLFYNGNNNGETGFGYAVLKD